MNKQRVNEIILSPGSVEYNTDLGVVNELIQSFPYFSTPYIMLSKMLHDENSIYFDKNLKISAAYAGNREILYNYIKSKEKRASEIQIAPELKELVSEKHYIPEQITSPVVEENPDENIIEVASDQPVLAQTVPEPVIISISPEKEPRKETSQKSSTLDLLQYPVSDYFGQYYKKNKKPIETELGIAKKPDDLLSGKKSFSAWLDALESTTVKPDNKKIPVKNTQDSPVVSDYNDLIFKFIQTEPKIRPQQSKMYKPEDMAKLSVMEDHHIATETLAEIYLKQGLKSRALEIFQQLILKYPEKSAYFAARIGEIQSEGTF